MFESLATCLASARHRHLTLSLIGILFACAVWLLTGTAAVAQSTQNATPLMNAAELGQTQIVRQLIAEGAKVGARDNKGATALHIAAINGHVEVAKLLLDHGAKIDRQTKEKYTPLYLAGFHHHPKLVDFLARRGANVNIDTGFGWTPLNVAALNNSSDVAKALLAHGANPNKKVNTGSTATPLALAAFQGSATIAQALLDAGADPMFKTGDGRSMVDAATNAQTRRVIQNFILEQTPRAERTLRTNLAVASKWQVCQIQEALTVLGYAPGALDGIAGAKVRSAVTAFLADRDIAETATLDELAGAILADSGQVSTEAEEALTNAATRPGTGRRLMGRKGDGPPFTIIAPPDGGDYYAKLIDPASGVIAAAYFVRNDKAAKMSAPFGEYELRYATGPQFFSKNCLFGRATRFGKADSLLEFTFDGTTYIGTTIRLIVESGGNLTHTDLLAENW